MNRTQAWRNICKLFPNIYSSQSIQIGKILDELARSELATGYHRGIKTRQARKKEERFHEMLDL